MNETTIVLPSIRPESYTDFYQAWKELFQKHGVDLVVVWDHEDIPYIEHVDFTSTTRKIYHIEDIMGEYSDIIYNKSDCVRNLGFAFVAKYLDAETIISLDDDVHPDGDTIQDHLDILGKEVPTTWISTTVDSYMRGFPYSVRKESIVTISHGVWHNIPDLDAPTQLLHPELRPSFYRGIIPKYAMYPNCAMNFAFSTMMLPYVYQAPMGPRVGLDRFGDIWGGIEMKKDIDLEDSFAVATGYASVIHTRASNVFKNLQKEAKGIEMNEPRNYGKGEYFDLFYKNRNRWKEFMYKEL